MDIVSTSLEQYSGMVALISGVGLLFLIAGMMGKSKNTGQSVSASRVADVKASIKQDHDASTVPESDSTEQDADFMQAEDQPEAVVAEAVHRPLTGVIILHVIAKSQDQPFKGYPLVQAFAQNHLHASENNHFQRFSEQDGQGKLWFHVASMRHPGVFDLDDPGMMSCPGLVLIMDCAQVDLVQEAFLCMLDTAHRLVADLDGILLDENKNPLTSKVMQHWRNEVANSAVADVPEAVS